MHTIWDVYNKLKARRDQQRQILEINADEPDGGSLTEGELDCLESEVMFLTRTLEEIDVAQHRVTEADEASVT